MVRTLSIYENNVDARIVKLFPHFKDVFFFTSFFSIILEVTGASIIQAFILTAWPGQDTAIAFNISLNLCFCMCTFIGPNV